MSINSIDIQSIETMRKTFRESGEAEFTHIETGMINGHKVEVLPGEQRRVNSDFAKNLAETLFPFDKNEAMMSTKNAFLFDMQQVVKNGLSVEGPLKGSQIAQVLGHAIEIMESSARLRESVTAYIKEKLTANECPDVEDMASFDLGLAYDLAERDVATEPNPQLKKTVWKKSVDRLIDKFLVGTMLINGEPKLDFLSKTVLNRMAFVNKEYAQYEYFKIAQAAYERVKYANLKEVLLNPDEFQDEDRARVLMNFGSQVADVFVEVHKDVEVATRDIEVVMQLVLAMIASNDKEIESYLATRTDDIQKLEKVTGDISGKVQAHMRPKDGLEETLYANRGFSAIKNLLVLSKGYHKVNTDLAPGYLVEFKQASGLTDAQCAKLNTRRVDKYLSKATSKEDRAARWKFLLEDIEKGFKILRESSVICEASKAAMTKAILEKPDLYESGALFNGPMSIKEELPTQELVEAFHHQGSLEALRTVAEFGKTVNNALLKLNLQEGIVIDAEGTALSTLMLMHILANHQKELARIIVDEENYLNALNVMLDGLYKNSSDTQEAMLYTNAKGVLAAMLSVKAEAGEGLKARLTGSVNL